MNTHHITASQALSVSPELAFCLMDHAPLGILIRDGVRIVWANRTFREHLDLTVENLAAAPANGHSPLDGLEILCGPEERIQLADPDGTAHWWERCKIERIDGSRSVWFFRNATSEVELLRSLDHMQRKFAGLETRDPETGLLTRQGLTVALDRELGRSRRYGNPVSVIRIDLKASHEPADENAILRELSQEFRARLRWADELGRLESNRFLLILPETTAECAQAVANDLLAERVVAERCAEGWHISAEVACWQKGDDRRLLLRRAGVED